MPDFKDLVKNLYKTKNRELSQEKFDYIIKTYSGKEEDFVKNFYKTVGEDLTQDKFNYIKSSYLTPQPEDSKKKVPTSESTPLVVSSDGKNDWKASVYGGLKDASKVAQKPVEVKQPERAVEKKFHEDDRNFIEKTTDVIVESIVSGALQVGSGVTGLVGGVADSLIKKKDLDKEYTPLSNEWIYGLIAQKGEVESPSWYSNQGIRDAMMNVSSKLAQAASMEAEVAKESIGVKDTGKQTIDHVLDGNYGEAGKSLVVDVIQQVPNLSIMALSGGSAGLATMGATSAGSSLQEEYAKDQDISAVDMAQSLTNGIVEVVSEKMFDLDIKAARKLGGKLSDYLGESGKIIKNKIAQEGSEAVSKEIVRGLGDVIKSSAKGAGQEVLEENIVTVADFLVSSIDEDNLNEEGFSQLLRDMGQTTLVAAGSGGSVSGLSALASQQKLTTEEKTAITNLKDIAGNKDLSKETRALAKEKIKSIYNEANQKATETYSKVSELPVEDVVDIIKRQKEIEQLEADKSSVSDVDMVDEIDAKINEKQESIRIIMNGRDNGEFSISNKDLPRNIEGFLNYRNNKSLSDIEKRMDNGELILAEDIISATNPLYEAIDGIEKNDNLSRPQKNASINIIEEKIKKIESYEFETSRETIRPEQKRQVLVSRKIVGTTSRGTRNTEEVTLDRFVGKEASVNGSGGTVEINERDNTLSVLHENGRTVLDFNYLDYDKTLIDKDGIVYGVSMTDTRNGDNIEVVDQDLAYDIAVKEKVRRLGDIEDAIFDDVYQTVIDPKIEREVLVNKGTISKSTTSTRGSVSTTSIATSQEITVGKGNKKVNIEEAASESELTPEQAAQKSQDMAIAVEAEMKKQRKDPLWRRLQKGIFNRKANLDSAFSDTQEGELAKAAHENISGYKSIADDTFVAARDYIYGGEGVKWSKDLPFGLKFEGETKLTSLNPEQRSSLDEIIFHRRVVNIDSNRDNKKLKVEKDIANLQAELKGVKSEKEKRAIRRNIDKLKRIKTDRVANPMGFNKEESSAALLGIKDRVGEETFNDLMQRSDRYFDTRRQMLEKMREEGLISDRTVDNLIEDEYVERQFLEYVFEDSQFQSSSLLSKDQLKSLKDGSEDLTMLDTELLLHTAMRGLESRIAWNRANKLLKEEAKNNPNVGKVAEFEVYKSKGKHVDIDGNLVDHVKGDVKVDPLTGKKMIKPAPKGYETILFFENGDVDGVYMPVKLAKEYKDVEKITTDLDPYLRKTMQTGTVKFFATLTNPLFAASNFFRDFAKTIFLSDTYGANLFTAIPDLTTRFSKNALMYSAHKAGIKNEYFDNLVSDFQKYGGKFEFLHKDGKTENLYKRTISKNRGAIAKFGGQAMNLYEGVTGFAGDVTETGMRLSIFEKARNELIKQNGENISDADMEKINILAVNKARAVMDYNKGGLATKWLDQFSPYLNAQVVGFTSDINYIVKNPKKFGAKMGQLGLMASSVVLYSMMNMDEEEYENIPDYIKNNFFIFPLAKKEGEPRKFLRFPKYQGIQPFSALFEQATIAAYNQLNGTNYGSSTSTSTRVADVLETWSPVPMSFNGLVQKLPPTVNASLAYAMNYDSFRDSYVSYEKNLGLKPSVEGLKDENVARFYKVIGAASEKAFGVEDALSPKRLQVATEKIITTPSTNFIIGQIYGIADWLTQSYELPIETETSKSVGTLAGAAKSKFIREIDMEYAQKQRMAKGTLGMELRSEKFIKKTQTEAMVDAGLDPVQIREEIEKIADDPMEKERLLKSAENYWKKDALEKENLPFYRVAKGVNSYFGGSVEDKAELTYEKLGGIDPNSEDFRDYVNTAIRMKMVSPKKTKGVSTLDRFLKRYNDIYNQSQSE